MKASDRNSAKWRLTILALLALLGGEVAWLLHDVPILRPGASRFVSSNSAGSPIAELVSTRESVRIQDPGDLLWQDTRAGQTLFRNQSLLTLENSRAEVAFLDGAGLVVDENSLVRIERVQDGSGSRVVVDLLRGTLHKRGSRGGSLPVEVRIGNARAEIRADAEATLATDRIVVQRGELTLRTQNGAIAVHGGEESRLAAPGTQGAAAPTARKLPFSLVSPRAGESVDASRAVAFEWDVAPTVAESGAQELEVSQDPSFAAEQTVRLRIGAAHPPLRNVRASLKLPASLESRTWHWRVRTVGASWQSQVETFTVPIPARPSLVFPLDGARIPVGASASLVWKGSSSDRNFELRLDEERSLDTGATRAELKDLKVGEHSWKVRATDASGVTGPWSPSRRFQVLAPAATREPVPQVIDPTLPPPAELMEPEIEPVPRPTGKPHSWLNWLIRDVEAAEPANAPGETKDKFHIRLKWKAVPGAKAYRIQVARTSAFKDVLAEEETPSPNWTWEYERGMENSKGRVFYRVATLNSAGKLGRYSPAKPVPIPKSIRKPETYSAVEPDGPPATDASVRPDVDVQYFAPGSAPPVVPAGPKVSPKPAPAPAHAPSKAPPPASRYSFSPRLAVGFGTEAQSSRESDLTSVHADPHLKSLFALEGSAGDASQPRQWSGELDARLSRFTKADSSPSTTQGAIRVLELSLHVLRWKSAGQEQEWKQAYGAGVVRPFRWIKADAQAVSAGSAVSGGPVYELRRDTRDSDNGFRLSLPITGVLTGGGYGIQANLWNEWSLTRGKDNSLGLRVEGELSHIRWGTPRGTGVTGWSIWIAPTFHFNSGS